MLAGVFALLAAEEVLSEASVSQLTAMQGLCSAVSERYDIDVETIVTREESVSFKLPRALRQAAAE